jgi:hypothetical protein
MATEYMTTTIKRDEALPQQAEDLRKTHEERLAALILQRIADYEAKGWTFDSREEGPSGIQLRFKRG